MKKLILTVAFLLMVPLGYAHERSYSDRVDIIEILDSYSERTGINFKKHFSIKARVNMIGLDMDELTQTNLIDILRMFGWVTYQNKNGVVYVLPEFHAHERGAEFGEIWGRQ